MVSVLHPPLSPTSRQTVLSQDRRYRYVLWREWGDEGCPFALFIGLNPSTADETNDDPTIRRCIAFAKTWGYGALCMVNLFAWRATDPKDMRSSSNPIGPENDAWLASLSESAAITIAAWGAHGSYLGRDRAVMGMLHNIQCLGLTKGGSPRHPLYLRANSRPVPLIGN